MMKKVGVIVLAMSLTLALSGCVGEKAPSAGESGAATASFAEQGTTAVSAMETTAGPAAAETVKKELTMAKLAGLTVRELAEVYGDDYLIESDWGESAVIRYADGRVPYEFSTGGRYSEGMRFTGDETILSVTYTVNGSAKAYPVTDRITTAMTFGKLEAALHPEVGYDIVYYAHLTQGRVDLFWDFGYQYPTEDEMPSAIRVGYNGNSDGGYTPSAYDAVIMEYAEQYSSQENIYGKFCYVDINNDGVPELIIEKGTCEADRCCYFYTMSGEEAVFLGSRSSIHAGLYLNDKGDLTLVARFNGVDEYETMRLEGTELVTVATGTVDMSETEAGAFGDSLRMQQSY